MSTTPDLPEPEQTRLPDGGGHPAPSLAEHAGHPAPRPTAERPRRRGLPSWYVTPPPAERDPRECPSPAPCRSYRAGHLMHFIQAGLIRRMPWGWRDGVVRGAGGDDWDDWDGTTVVDYLDGSGEAEIWHHHDPSLVAPGSPVRLHERYHAVQAGRVVLNVLMVRGVGPVPEPAEPELWAGEGEAIFVNLASGVGHLPPLR